VALPRPFRPPKGDKLEGEIASAKKPVLIYFIEPRSNLCQLIEPAVSKVAQEHINIFTFIAARIRDYRDYFYQWGIKSCPAFIIFRDGKELRRLGDFHYTDEFKHVFKDFLVGRFLFETSKFELVDSVSFPHIINTGTYFHLVAVMNPAEPTNWQVSPSLEKIKSRASSQVRLSLVNATKNPDLVKKQGITKFPTVLLFQEGACLKRWDDFRNISKFVRDCLEKIRGD